jgi:hypothetical protein
MDDHPELKEPFREAPHYKGISGTAANLIRYVAEQMH